VKIVPISENAQPNPGYFMLLYRAT
jgi:hypothetical protein